jgi:hypothetical protein
MLDPGGILVILILLVQARDCQDHASSSIVAYAGLNRASVLSEDKGAIDSEILERHFGGVRDLFRGGNRHLDEGSSREQLLSEYSMVFEKSWA